MTNNITLKTFSEDESASRIKRWLSEETSKNDESNSVLDSDSANEKRESCKVRLLLLSLVVILPF